MKKLINKIISRNVSPERKIYVRSMPLFMKSIVLRRTYYKSGADQYSGVITNLGLVKLPDEIMKLIDCFVFIPPPPNKKLKVNCGIVGFNDKLMLSFGNISQSKELEKKFFRFFSDLGIKIRLLHY